MLNGTPLPWIEDAKYLGNTITSIPDGFCKDAKQKRGRYIERNCEIIQEFPTAHPDVKCKINRIYNSSFPGSVLYDMTRPAPPGPQVPSRRAGRSACPKYEDY